ncbi:Hypp5461 [Branchiostoma lanceolatum]|uniref:Hypp5461 protein n=1 Tax=Branchiostoma lanceolatum TaxID=7740 RepID=A0A8J9VDK4_BRALA|nr:Hypp5461 [Branchiostoma lanceolatum]
MRRYRHTSSPTEMLKDLGWASLQVRRRTARLAMPYKIQHSIISTEGLKDKLQHHGGEGPMASSWYSR